jgi:hypothetical protein
MGGRAWSGTTDLVSSSLLLVCPRLGRTSDPATPRDPAARCTKHEVVWIHGHERVLHGRTVVGCCRPTGSPTRPYLRAPAFVDQVTR